MFLIGKKFPFYFSSLNNFQLEFFLPIQSILFTFSISLTLLIGGIFHGISKNSLLARGHETGAVLVTFAHFFDSVFIYYLDSKIRNKRMMAYSTSNNHVLELDASSQQNYVHKKNDSIHSTYILRLKNHADHCTMR